MRDLYFIFSWPRFDPASMLVPAKKGDARSILILRRAICAFKIIYYTYGNNWSRFTENIITEFSKFQQRRVLYLKEYSRTRRNSMPKTITFWKTWLDNYPLQEYPDAFSRFSIPTKNSFESSLNENLSIVLFANRCELRRIGSK